ncbi:MAG: HDOD domain-containing protein [Sphingomonadaceae bacterium]
MTDPAGQSRKRRADQWLNTVNNLPPFPSVVQEVMALLDSNRSSAKDVARVISRDEAITAKILRVVNSAFYGTHSEVTTVSHAVTLLGFEQLRLLIVGVALLEQGRVRNPLADQARKRIWEHSTACARWSQELARATRYQPVEEAAVAGLLHDVGKVVLAVSSPKEFTNSVVMSQAEGISSWEAEEKSMGFNHVETGRMVAERWRLPSVVRYSIGLHHSPWPLGLEDDKDAKKLQHLLAIVRVANHAAKQSLAQNPADDASEPRIVVSPEVLLERVYEVNGLLMD